MQVSTQQQLNVIKSRAAVVLNRTSSSSSNSSGDYRSLAMRPRLSVEAIVASLEREIRDQLGPDLPPLPAPVLDAKDARDATTAAPSIIDVERFGSHFFFCNSIGLDFNSMRNFLISINNILDWIGLQGSNRLKPKWHTLNRQWTIASITSTLSHHQASALLTTANYHRNLLHSIHSLLSFC